MKSKWRCNKLILILIGILFFIGLAYAEDLIKPTPTNLLLKDLRVMASWVEEIECIGNIDAKYTGPGRGPLSGYARVNAMLDGGLLNIIALNRSAEGWGKARSHFFGQMSHEEAQAQWMVYKPIRDLLDLAIPADVPLFLEWWVGTSLYRVFFESPTNKDIDKLNAYVVEIMVKANKLKSSEPGDGSDGRILVSDNSRRWHVGKSTTMVGPRPLNGPDPRPLMIPKPGGPGPEVGKGSGDEKISDRSGGHMPYAYIKVIGGGAQHRVFLDPRIFTEYRGWSLPPIWDVDANYAYAVGELSWLPTGDGENRKWRGWWPKAYPSVPGSRRLSETECFKAVTELVNNLAQIANKHGLQVSNEQKKALFDRFAETDCRVGGENGKGDTMSWPDPNMIAADDELCPCGCGLKSCGCQADAV